jgi:hypothetical protein
LLRRIATLRQRTGQSFTLKIIAKARHHAVAHMIIPYLRVGLGIPLKYTVMLHCPFHFLKSAFGEIIHLLANSDSYYPVLNRHIQTHMPIGFIKKQLNLLAINIKYIKSAK